MKSARSTSLAATLTPARWWLIGSFLCVAAACLAPHF